MLPQVNKSELIYQLLKYTNDIILHLDDKGNIISSSTQAKNFFSYNTDKSNTNNFNKICQNNQLICPLQLFESTENNFHTLKQEIKNTKEFDQTIEWQLIKSENENTQLLIGKIITNKQQDTLEALNNIVNLTPGSLYWKDQDGKYLGCNNFMLSEAGLQSLDEIVGKTDQQLWPQFAKQFSKNDDYVIQSGKTIFTDEKALVGDKLMYFVGVKSPLKNKQGETIGIIGNSFDITSLKEAQMQLQYEKRAAVADNHAKSEFIANMSHDIRTPLSGIIGLTEILMSSLQNSAVVKFAKDAHSAANQLMQLLNEILEISDIRAGNINDIEQTFNLETILYSIKELMCPSIENKGLNLQIDYDNNIPDQLSGYRILLHRVLLNLVSNAIKFTSRGNISITANLYEQAGEDVNIQICVADTGIGIPGDKLNIIFEPFKRLTPAFENNYQGTGLGLYVVKKFLDMLGGKITVQSKINHGTSFELFIPLKAATEISTNLIDHSFLNSITDNRLQTFSPEAHHLTAPLTTQSNNNQRILVVEDDPMAQIVSKVQLSKQQCQVDIANTSQQALQLIKKNCYGLILMDIGLPDKNGVDTSKEIREYESKNNDRRTPIIALTAHINKKNHQECQQAGIDHILKKPLSNKLAEKIVYTFLKKTLPPEQLETVIDLNETAAIVGGNKQTAKELINLFIEQLPGDQKKIEQAFLQKEWIQLKALVHKLHGATSYCGVRRLKQTCYQLEIALNEDPLQVAVIGVLYQNLTQEINEVRHATLS